MLLFHSALRGGNAVAGGGGGGDTISLSGYSGAGTKSRSTPFFLPVNTNGISASAAGYTDGEDTVGTTSTVIVDSTGGAFGLPCLKIASGHGANADNVDYTGENFEHIHNLMPANCVKVFRSGYFRIERTADWQTPSARANVQIKWGRLGVGGYNGPDPRYRSSIWLNVDESWAELNRGWSNTGGFVVDGSIYTNPNWVVDGHNYCEFEAVWNPTVGVANGVYRISINGVNLCNHTNTEPRLLSSEYITFMYLTPGIDIPWGTEWTQYYTRDYLDDGIGRIVTTDSATYASSTKWMTRKYTSWADTSSSFESENAAEIAIFGDGATVYDHVFSETDGTRVYTSAARTV